MTVAFSNIISPYNSSSTLLVDSVVSTPRARRYLPDVLRKGKKATGELFGKIRRIVAGASVLVPSMAMGLLCVFPRLFTDDAGVIVEMGKLAPYVLALILPHAAVLGVEGVLLSRRDLKFLSLTYCLNTVLVSGALMVGRRMGLGICTRGAS